MLKFLLFFSLEERESFSSWRRDTNSWTRETAIRLTEAHLQLTMKKE